MNFENLFSRSDDGLLQRLLGKAGIRLINAIFPDTISPSDLRELIIKLYSKEALISSKKIRPLMLDMLRPNEAKELLKKLGKETEDDLYKSLRSLKINRGSLSEKKLFQFFEISPPEPDVIKTIPDSLTIEPPYPLFPYQRNAVKKILKILHSDTPRVILHMPTGSGKTRTAMHIVSQHFKEKEQTVVVWLAYSEELCEQAAQEFMKAWGSLGDRAISLYRFWGNHTIELENLNTGFIVASFSKVYNAFSNNINFVNQLAKKTSLTIIDEAHQAIAETYKLILNALTVQTLSKRLLGLTATPGRTYSDIDLDEELAFFFAKQKVILEVEGYDNPVDYLVEEGYLAKSSFKPLFYHGNFSLSSKDITDIHNELEIPRRILQKLAEDEIRNLRIIVETERLILNAGHKRVLLFATTVDHSDLISAVLQVRGIESYSVTSKTPRELRTNIIRKYKAESDTAIVLCNYGVLAAGFDAPKTSAAIIARPTKSLVLYSQMTGRAIRGIKAGGNKKAEIITVVDSTLPGFNSVSEAFVNWEDVYNE